MSLVRNCLILLIFSGIIFSQTKNVNGRVLERDTGKPLVGVNVFLDGTTRGTTTDTLGYFTIKNLKYGFYDIVVSMIGYETKSKRIRLSEKNLKSLKFELKERIYKTSSIVIEDEENTSWQRSYNIFKKLFLGTSVFARDCEVVNKEIIEFKDSKEYLTGFSNEPIIIINKALGFKINTVLKDFYYDKLREKTWFQLKNFFQELVPRNIDEEIRWNINRKKAYETSMEYFLTWLQNEERDESRFKFTQVRYRQEEFLRENNEKEIRDLSILYTKINEENYILNFPYFLRIEDIKYAEESILKLFYPSVAIDKYGFVLQQHAFEVYGYFGKTGLADKLPKSFYTDHIDSNYEKQELKIELDVNMEVIK